MGLKILHSADWRRLPFAGFDDSQRALKAGQQSIPGKTAQLCRREKCDLMLLAGDIFDGEPARETVEALKKRCPSAAHGSSSRRAITISAPRLPLAGRKLAGKRVCLHRRAGSRHDSRLNCRVYGAGYQSMDSAPSAGKFPGGGQRKNTASPCSTAIPPEGLPLLPHHRPAGAGLGAAISGAGTYP